MGRPAIPYDPVIAEELCHRIVESCRGLDHVLKEMRNGGFPSTPSRDTIYKWMIENPEFSDKSARAMQLSADTYADAAVEAAQVDRIGTITTTQEWGEQVKVADNVERSKLIVQTLLKRAGQLNPKKYGEKLAHTGADGEGPITFVVTRAGKKA